MNLAHRPLEPTSLVSPVTKQSWKFPLDDLLPMYSLNQSLLAQHPRQLLPVRCAGSTIAQLHRYFEDVVLENRLDALVAESMPAATERSARDVARLQELGEITGNLFALWRELVAGIFAFSSS